MERNFLKFPLVGKKYNQHSATLEGGGFRNARGVGTPPTTLHENTCVIHGLKEQNTTILDVCPKRKRSWEKVFRLRMYSFSRDQCYFQRKQYISCGISFITTGKLKR